MQINIDGTRLGHEYLSAEKMLHIIPKNIYCAILMRRQG